jgi:hypothetical protein
MYTPDKTNPLCARPDRAAQLRAARPNSLGPSGVIFLLKSDWSDAALRLGLHSLPYLLFMPFRNLCSSPTPPPTIIFLHLDSIMLNHSSSLTSPPSPHAPPAHLTQKCTASSPTMVIGLLLNKGLSRACALASFPKTIQPLVCPPPCELICLALAVDSTSSLDVVTENHQIKC